eukprot:scaffold127505_cov33-Tisochrysis_lutea.AAC.1
MRAEGEGRDAVCRRRTQLDLVLRHLARPRRRVVVALAGPGGRVGPLQTSGRGRGEKKEKKSKRTRTHV